MTPEEQERWERIDRLVEFLAANQAELSARNAEISEEIRQHSAYISQNSAQIAQNSVHIAQHSIQIAQLTGETRELGRYVLNLAHIVERTDQRLNVVIEIVERHFGNGRS